jgi:hypothetical protein
MSGWQPEEEKAAKKRMESVLEKIRVILSRYRPLIPNSF